MSASTYRSGVKAAVVCVALLSSMLVVVVSCTNPTPPAAGDGTHVSVGPGSCTTPDMGCPCSPGSVVPCSQQFSGPNNFLYCYKGYRSCSAAGVYGACLEGSVVTKSLAGSGLHISNLGTPSACAGADTGPLSVCTSGKKQGEYCTTGLDCTGGVKKCAGGADDGASCKKEKDCADPGLCTSFNGTCAGGTRNGFGCDSLADCPGGATACTAAGGGGTCGTFSGICDNGTNDGEACNADADCGGGQCKTDKRGHCQGGKENGKKCRHNKHCKGGDSCSAEDSNEGGLIDPCDPYCNVTADNAVGLVVPGFNVVNGGLTPIPPAAIACGDSIVSPTETCDDGNTTGGDGCSPTCKIEPGYKCTGGGPGTCTTTTCGDGVKEGLEECDDGPWAPDGNGRIADRPYDGCFQCKKEFNCPVVGAGPTACAAVCGDGIVFPGEGCDDGNIAAGDGCSPTCTVEAGATCTTVTAPLPTTIDVPAVYHDVQTCAEKAASPACSNNGSAGYHPDFEGAPSIPHNTASTVHGQCGPPGYNSVVPGIVASALASDGKPAFSNTANGLKCAADTASFDQWYHDGPLNKVILGRFLRLAETTPGTYVFNSTTDNVTAADFNCGTGGAVSCSSLTGFWPINNIGYGNYTRVATYNNRNFGFTSEVRFPFTYTGPGTLSFTGDDDVFVFIGGKLVVDLGGIHNPLSGSIAVNTLGLTANETYEIAVFQAERNTGGSNYRLTLAGFTKKTSSCTVPTPPPPPSIFVRDFQGICPIGKKLVWQLFRWKAAIPTGAQIDFRAATALTQATLPASPPAAAPTTVPIGSATPTNSPSAGPVVFVNDSLAGNPQPVSLHLTNEGANTVSKEWLRVYMTFTGTGATLFDWQQLFDCIPEE